MQSGTTRDQQLCFNNVHRRDFFGHRMLDLNAWIDFDEVKRAVVDVVEEFDRSGVLVARFLGEANRRLTHALAGFFVQPGGRRHFHDFLVTALDRAVAFE